MFVKIFLKIIRGNSGFQYVHLIYSFIRNLFGKINLTVYPTLMGSKTPPQNAAKAKKLGGVGLPLKSSTIISGDEEPH